VSDEVTAFRWADESQIAELADQTYVFRVLDAMHYDQAPAIRAHDGVHLLASSGSQPWDGSHALADPRSQS
jgi:8-oxo-dGTP diphosphatase